jgi:hypothetical protein
MRYCDFLKSQWSMPILDFLKQDTPGKHCEIFFPVGRLHVHAKVPWTQCRWEFLRIIPCDKHFESQCNLYMSFILHFTQGACWTIDIRKLIFINSRPRIGEKTWVEHPYKLWGFYLPQEETSAVPLHAAHVRRNPIEPNRLSTSF